MPKGVYVRKVETWRKISASLKGHSVSEETKRKLKGITRSEEFRKKLSLVRKDMRHTEETKRKISLGNLGKHRSEETREKISVSHKDYKHPVWVRMKMSSTHKKKFLDPTFVAQFKVWSNKRYVQGSFKSYKNSCDIYFGSSYELYAYIKLEHDCNVKQYGRCCFSIPYFYKGSMRRYIPDIGVECMDGTKTIIEVKPSGRVKEVENVIKASVAREYCRENGMNYEIWTESEIFNVHS